MAQGNIIVHAPESYLEGGVAQPVSLDFNDDVANELEFNTEETEVANTGTFYKSYYDEQEFFMEIPNGSILTAYNYLFPFISGPSIMEIYDIIS